MKTIREEDLRVMKEVFGEAMSWLGYSTPNVHMMKMRQGGGPGFPFYTRAGERIWEKAQPIAWGEEKMTAQDILVRAAGEAKVDLHEIAPEDYHVLMLAIAWAQSGRSAEQLGDQSAKPFGTQSLSKGTRSAE